MRRPDWWDHDGYSDLSQAHPSRIDWWRILGAALMLVGGAATLLGIYGILVYVLTAF